MSRLTAALLIVTTISGCANSVTRETATTSLENATSCCESMAQIHYKDIGFGASDSIRIDSSSDAFQFASGKSYFVAFRLPAFVGRYKITIQSYALGETIDKAHVFYPQVDLLDEKSNLVAQSSPQDFVLNAPLPLAERKTSGLPFRLEGFVIVDNPDVKHMVVYTTTELLYSANPYVTRRFVPIIFPGIVGAIPTHKEEIYIRHSPFGLLYIVLERATE